MALLSVYKFCFCHHYPAVKSNEAVKRNVEKFYEQICEFSGTQGIEQLRPVVKESL